ncbi:MAG: hypothetical protein ABI425_04145 [Patescibacteria group bacterium]
MLERAKRIELKVNIPGPKSIDDPLENVEKIFLQRKLSGVVEAIEQGRLWQDY